MKILEILKYALIVVAILVAVPMYAFIGKSLGFGVEFLIITALIMFLYDSYKELQKKDRIIKELKGDRFIE